MKREEVQVLYCVAGTGVAFLAAAASTLAAVLLHVAALAYVAAAFGFLTMIGIMVFIPISLIRASGR